MIYRLLILHGTSYKLSQQIMRFFLVRGVRRGGPGASSSNSTIFWATDSRFCMEVRMDSPNKIQKYKKYKKVHKYSYLSHFWVTDSRFCMELHMNCLNKLWGFLSGASKVGVSGASMGNSAIFCVTHSRFFMEVFVWIVSEIFEQNANFQKKIRKNINSTKSTKKWT